MASMGESYTVAQRLQAAGCDNYHIAYLRGVAYMYFRPIQLSIAEEELVNQSLRESWRDRQKQGQDMREYWQTGGNY